MNTCKQNEYSKDNFYFQIGAHYRHDGSCEFTVWAPLLQDVALVIVHPVRRRLSMEQDGLGYWKVIAHDISPGARYFYSLKQSFKRPDPASFFQPQGVHGPSEVIHQPDFTWEDLSWRGISLEEMIIYELHVGTFTPEGTFAAIIPRLNDLKDLGITAIEIMPVAQFPGERNWGYDGVYPFAVQNSYGGPDGLKQLVNACHKNGLAVILDVVYNHLGPEGNYLGDFGPYFTEKYKTPWGSAINFDSAYCDGVRNYFVINALFWFRHYHIDALRLDAIHGIYDMSPTHILEEIAGETEKFSSEQGRKFYLIAESDLNNPRIIRPRSVGGHGIDAQWCDDFHHSLHTLLTGERGGYYADFGSIGHLKTAFAEGYVYSGQYSACRKRRHGASARLHKASQFVVYSQNHDQVGNRMLGERLSDLVNFEGLKLAAGTVFLSRYIPLLFMGEEYGEASPFFYFIDHSDPELIRAVCEGRKSEFRSFAWRREPPDPQDLETFCASKLKWDLRSLGNHNVLLNLYRQLIKLKKELPALRCDDSNLRIITGNEHNIMTFERFNNGRRILGIMNFNKDQITTVLDLPEGRWNKLLDSADSRWMGPGALLPDVLSHDATYRIPPLSFVLYEGKQPL
ncbi:MAG: malto-oligosyltrehalose trehalohydrolase [Syntrophales bacterium]|nr:malto-oligosyltrehalose trehalohydrolase [Syntrophales bacterium]